MTTDTPNHPPLSPAAACGESQVMNWKPIETAPRDGKFFIGANAKEVIVCNWPKQRDIDYAPGNWRKGRGEWDGSFIRTDSPLTHWQELPELPLPEVDP